MKTLNFAKVARDFGAILQHVESAREEVVVTRDRNPIARFVPEPAGQTALEIFGDLHRIVDDATADAITNGVARARTP